jgi:hypothetical protein
MDTVAWCLIFVLLVVFIIVSTWTGNILTGLKGLWLTLAAVSIVATMYNVFKGEEIEVDTIKEESIDIPSDPIPSSPSPLGCYNNTVEPWSLKHNNSSNADDRVSQFNTHQQKNAIMNKVYAARSKKMAVAQFAAEECEANERKDWFGNDDWMDMLM